MHEEQHRRRPSRLGVGYTSPLRIVLAVDAIAVGLGYLLGPARWYSSGTFAVVRDLGVPIPVWGGVFTIIGVLLLVPATARVGHSLGSFVYGFWAICQLATLADDELQAWGHPWHTLALGGLHGIGLARATADRVGGPR